MADKRDGSRAADAKPARGDRAGEGRSSAEGAGGAADAKGVEGAKGLGPTKTTGVEDLRPWRLSARRLSDLRPAPDAPREDMGDVDALGRSIARHGLLVPILIEPDGTVRAGSRRVEALRSLDPAAEVECLILPPGTDPSVAQLVENLQRANLTPVEEARAYRALIDATGWTQGRAAREVGVPESRVSTMLNLLKAPPEVREKVDSGDAGAWDVAAAFSLRGHKDGRARGVVARLGGGGKVHARYGPASVKVPASELPEGVRAKVFADRVEITVTLRDETPGLEALGGFPECVRAPLAAAAGAVLDALRAARARVLGLEGLSEMDE